jgi:hypothetical protein
MFFGSLGFVVYASSVVYVVEGIVLVSSVVLGVAVALLWVAFGSYLTQVPCFSMGFIIVLAVKSPSYPFFLLFPSTLFFRVDLFLFLAFVHSPSFNLYPSISFFLSLCSSSLFFLLFDFVFNSSGFL